MELERNTQVEHLRRLACEAQPVIRHFKVQGPENLEVQLQER